LSWLRDAIAYNVHISAASHHVTMQSVGVSHLFDSCRSVADT